MRQIKAIILAGSRDFGRCPIASRVSPALWPVFDKPVLAHLLHNLSEQGIKRGSNLFQWRHGTVAKKYQEYGFYAESVFSRTNFRRAVPAASVMRQMAIRIALFIVLNAATVLPPNINELVRAHHAGKCEMTVVFEPCADNEYFGQPTVWNLYL